MSNLALAFPEKSKAERSRILRGEFTSLGRQLAEVCRFPRYTLENIEQVVVYDGFENYEAARARGKGVLLFAGHFGGWELSSFVLSMHGDWMHVLMRGMDNEYLGRLILHYRTMHGNKAVDKDESVRSLAFGDEGGRSGGDADRHEHDSAAGNLREFFRHCGLHREWDGEDCVAHRRGRGANVYDLGCRDGEIPAEV